MEQLSEDQKVERLIVRAMAAGPDPVLKECARDIAAGRTTLRDAIGETYSRHFAAGAAELVRRWGQMPPAERRAVVAGAAAELDSALARLDAARPVRRPDRNDRAWDHDARSPWAGDEGDVPPVIG